MQNNEVPYKSLDRQPVTLETRIYALTLLYKSIQRLNLLNKEEQSEDIRQIRELILNFVDNTIMESAPDSENMVNIEKYGLDNLEKTKTGEFLQRHKSHLLKPHHNFMIIGKGKTESVTADIQKIVSTILQVEVPSGKKAPKIDTNELAGKIINASWDNEEELDKTIKLLQSIKGKIKQRLKSDWKQYQKKTSQQSTSSALSAIEKDVLSIIGDDLNIVYKEKNNPEIIKVANSEVRKYYIDKDPHARIAFLKMMGILMQSGKNILHNSNAGNENNYNKVIDLITAEYKDNPDIDNIINQALNVKDDGKDLHKARLKAFEELSTSVYINTVAGLLTMKQEKEKNHTVPKGYIDNIAAYIKNLTNGSNNVSSLDLLDFTEDYKKSSYMSEWQLLKANQEDTKAEKIATIHHKYPIASAITLYMALNPKKYGDRRPEDLQEDELRSIIPLAQKLVNHIGNLGFPIGKASHEHWEPHGKYSINKNKDNAILTSSYDKENVANIIRTLNLPTDIKNNYIKALNNYGTNTNEKGDHCVTMKLPDHGTVEAYRDTLTDGKELSPVNDVARIFGIDKNPKER